MSLATFFFVFIFGSLTGVTVYVFVDRRLGFQVRQLDKHVKRLRRKLLELEDGAPLRSR